MLEIRFHGRGGSGTVLASRALAKAVFYAGKYAVTFPSFGAERRGAPVLAFARIDDKKIYKRTQIYEPDAIVVLDDGLIELIDVAKGIKDGGIGILNTAKKPEQIKLSKSIKAAVVDATKIAIETIGRPITNSAILGALIRAIPIVSFDELERGILAVFGERLGEEQAKKNVEAARRAYNETIFGTTQGGRDYEQHKPWLPTVNELPIGTILDKTVVQNNLPIGPGSATVRITGTWDHKKAKIDNEKCIQCLQCLFHCPEGTIYRNGNNVVVDWKYCKACGVCISVCPKNAIEFIEIEDFSQIIKK